MELNNLRPAKGSTGSKKRIGRGQGSGMGGTSTKGHNGQKSRSGYSKKIGFEGGQMPLQRRVPKFGFKNINRVEYKAVNLDILNNLVEKGITDINNEVICANGLASKNELVKVLGRGEISAAINLKVNAISETAKKAIEEKGGTVELV
ncbi:50S ribosomal protein L15 [Flavobacteriales bacterium]|jgi:large subunit ribosomal protein L15|nr:50S ribosomal protein L15 [Flavobacteriales bacterium]